MAKFYMMGNYTTQGFQGFLKDPKSDRSKAAQAAADAWELTKQLFLQNL